MSEILINTTTTGLQHQPAIAPFSDTHFFVVWTDGSDRTIKGRFIRADGTPSGDEFVVSATTPTGANTNRHLPTIARSGSGPIVAWIEDAVNPPGPTPHVKLQRFRTDGQPSGSGIQVSNSEVDPKGRPAIAGMIDGGFLVSWMDRLPDRRIRAQRFSFDGAKKGPEFQVNTTEGFHEAPIATRLVGGNYVIAWRSAVGPPGGGALIFRIFDLEGAPVVGETKPNLTGFTGQKAMTFLDDKDQFVIAYCRGLGDSDIGEPMSAVQADVFETNGASANIPFFATSGEEEIESSSPTLAAVPGAQEEPPSRRFLLGWVQKRADTVATTPSVRARIFSAIQGDSVGQEVQVNTTTTGDRFDACVAAIFNPEAGGTAFVAWVEDSQVGGDTSDLEVRGRMLPILASGGLG
jgi:hypothetical protein